MLISIKPSGHSFILRPRMLFLPTHKRCNATSCCFFNIYELDKFHAQPS